MDSCFTTLLIAVVVVFVGIVQYAFQSAKREQTAALAKKEAIREHFALRSLRATGSTVDVVGESNYHWALRTISKADDSGARERSQTAWLLAEPGNPHDANAVQVLIDDDVVGYLSRARAAKYQPLVERARAAGFRITCSAEISGGWIDDQGERRNFGVTLYLAAPKALQQLLDERLP